MDMNEKKDENIKGGRHEEDLKNWLEIAVAFSKKKSYIWGIVLGISVGALFCIVGLVIIILGFNGSIEWIFRVGNVSSKLMNAGPGVFFALLGMLILWRYRPMPHERLSITRGHDVSYEFHNPGISSFPLSAHVPGASKMEYSKLATKASEMLKTVERFKRELEELEETTRQRIIRRQDKELKDNRKRRKKI